MIHIVSITDPGVADAVAKGRVECGYPNCDKGKLWLDIKGHTFDCPRCGGRGHTVTHDLTRGPLANGSVSEWHVHSERTCFETIRFPNCKTRAEAEAALDAIHPGDSLAHDGTELGRRCAEVVVRVAEERRKA